MSDDKKLSEEKKYAQIWHSFVRHCGDAVGFTTLPNDVIALLAEDSNYRLREAVQNAGQFMRHAKRKKLTHGDFNNALWWSDVEPIHGYSCPEPLPFLNVKEAEVFCAEDHEINLVLMAAGNTVYEHPGVPSLHAQWLAIEGVQKVELSAQIAGKKNGTVSPVVSEHLMAYYSQVTKAILGNSEDVTKMALHDLKTNPKIGPLLPFFINFVCVGVKKVSHDLTQLTKLLQTVWSLTDNKYLYLGPRPMLKLLVQGVLYCIVEPLAASLNPINDHWALRDYAARLLANIVRVWNTPVNRLYHNTLSALQDIFKDLTKPFCSHYGAIVAMMALGIEPVRTCVCPNISRYWAHLTATLEDSSRPNVPFKSDANKVYGALLLASEFLILQEHREMIAQTVQPGVTNESDHEGAAASRRADDAHKMVTEGMSSSSAQMEGGVSKLKIKSEFEATTREAEAAPKRTFSPAAVYNELYDYFGDALAARLPYIHVPNFYAPKQPKMVNLFTTPELSQTGEELLEAFVVKEDEVLSNSMEDDHYSYDDNSPMSDEVEPVDVDLRIKSTVSDPTLGIKLTIAKLPRSLPPPPPVKVKKLSIKIPKQPEPSPPPVPAPVAGLLSEEEERGPPPSPEGTFSSVLVKEPEVYIEFNFVGSMPIQKEKLKRKRIENHQFSNLGGIANQVHVIGLRMKKVGRRRKRPSVFADVCNRAIRIFRTGNILVSV